MSTKKHVRRKFLVDKKFQLGFVFFASIFMGMISIAIGITIPWILAGEMDILNLIGGSVALVVIFLLVCVAFSHSIAGPVFKMGKIIRQVTDGNIPDYPFSFRKTDPFHGLASDFNQLIEMIKSQKKQHHTSLVLLKELNDKITNSEISKDEVGKAIQRLINAFEAE